MIDKEKGGKMLYNCMIFALSIFSFNRLPYKNEFLENKKQLHFALDK